MKCQDAEKLILLKDSGELNGSKDRVLAAHLHDCEPCRRLQHALIESKELFAHAEEPPHQVIANVMREARRNAPENRKIYVFGLRPALAVAASVLVLLGIFAAFPEKNRIGMELVVNETQLLEPEDQVDSVMYSGLSEDDLAFNFMMTYDGNGQG